MASGTLRNLAESAFVRTPPSVTIRVLRNLLAQRLPSGEVMLPHALAGDGYPITVLDPTCGEGDLLEPLAAYDTARLFGVEISAERAAESRKRLPGAAIVTTALEATRITPQSLSLVLTNPPYMVVNGHRLEYAVIRESGKALLPGGIMVAIIPARQWDGTMVNHWARNYENIRAWRFADGDPETVEESFARFTQIVVIGVRREQELEKPDPGIKAAIAGWRWRIPDSEEESPWAGGVELPIVPDAPIADPYIVPPSGAALPEIKVVRADDSQLLLALDSSGAHLSQAWQAATQWQGSGRVDAPVMPATGTAHLAADILTGLLDGDVVTGPDGQPYIFNTFVTSEMAPIEVDEDQKGKGVVRILQQQDKAVLTVLSLGTGAVNTYTGVDAFAFLKPWLPTLAVQVRAKRQPVYDLHAFDWEIAVMAEIGLDKALPGAELPGLAAPQIHRSIAMLRALEVHRKVAIQGEMGTGKTRMLTGLIALFAKRWACRPEVIARALAPHHDRIAACRDEITARMEQDRAADVSDLKATLRGLIADRQAVLDGFAGFTGAKAPAWIKDLQSAWRNNRHLKLLGITRPLKALPVAVASPKRVTTVWEYEIAAAYPGCETIVIESHHDVRRWLRRCTESDALAVVAIFPQSLTRPGRVVWKPAVLQKQVEAESVVTEEAKAEHAQWDTEKGRWTFPAPGKGGAYDPALPVRELLEMKQRDKVVGFTDKLTGRTITEWLITPNFFCPDCGKLVEGEPRGRKKEREDTDAADAAETKEETLEPVTSITYFVKQQRSCRHCDAPLWTRVWTPATEAKAGMPTFGIWSAAAGQLAEQARVRAVIAETDKTKKRRKPRNPQRITTCPVERPEEQFEAEITRYNAKDAAWDELTVGVTLSDPIEDSFSPYECAPSNAR
ncbi:MAG TPA: DUF6094 domain-containing protein [Dehalococcoidia bacterium]|nr:DUF6094 domain-containing protein [Dehalococcoidia bacterium]